MTRVVSDSSRSASAASGSAAFRLASVLRPGRRPQVSSPGASRDRYRDACTCRANNAQTEIKYGQPCTHPGIGLMKDTQCGWQGKGMGYAPLHPKALQTALAAGAW